MKRTYGALILAGGKGRRMNGQNKALLQLEQQTFLSRLEGSLSAFDEKMISVQDASWLVETPFVPVLDQMADRGPLEGLRCALSQCRSDALLVVACDMPLFSADLANALLQAAEGHDAVICKDSEGYLHPLCGVYSKQCLPVIEALATQGDFRVVNIMKEVKSTILSFDGTELSDELLANVNTPEALEAIKADTKKHK